MNKGTSRKSRFLSPGWLMFFSALLCVVLVPVVQAAMRYTSERSQRLQELSRMTESERLKIQNSFAEFQKLSPAEQESYRELDRRLNQEDLQLKDTLANYQEFLSTLSPVERVDIDHARTKRDRLEAIEQILEQRASLQRQLDTALSMMEAFRARHSGHFREVFSTDEMAAIADLIEPRLPRSAREKADLESPTVVVRFARVMAAALDAWRPRPPEFDRKLLDDDLMTEVIGAIKNEEILNEFNQLSEAEHRAIKLIDYSIRSVLKEQIKSNPDVNTLYKFLETRDAKVKDELMSMDPRWTYLELLKLYHESNPTPLSKAWWQLSKEKEEFFPPRGRWGRGNGGRRGSDDDNRGRSQRNGERPPTREGEEGFNDNRQGRGFRSREPGERFGNGGRPEQSPSEAD